MRACGRRRPPGPSADAKLDEDPPEQGLHRLCADAERACDLDGRRAFLDQRQRFSVDFRLRRTFFSTAAFRAACQRRGELEPSGGLV